MKQLFGIVAILSISACGNLKSNSVDANKARVQTQTTNSESLYNSMGSYEENVNYYLAGNLTLGVSVIEKSQAEMICQKRVTVSPNAIPRYSCFKLISTANSDAQTTYSSLPSAEYSLVFSQNGQQLLGQSTYEKMNSDLTVLCRRFAAVVPNAVFNFKCYSVQ